MNNTDLHLDIKPLIHFMARFHGIIFFLFLGASLIAGVAIVLGILTTPIFPSEDAAPGVSAGFDEATISKVKALDTSDTNPPNQKRTNPFIEE